MSVKYKHKIIVIDINSVEDSEKFQKLAYSHGFDWGCNEEGNIFTDSECYYYLDMKDWKITMSGHPGNKQLDEFRVKDSNGKIYTINKYDSVNNIIIYGTDIPNYKPKKIVRKL